MIFNESTCPSGSNYDMSCDADSDPSAKMWATPLPPAATKPVELAAADAPGVADKATTDLDQLVPQVGAVHFAPRRAAHAAVADGLVDPAVRPAAAAVEQQQREHRRAR